MAWVAARDQAAVPQNKCTSFPLSIDFFLKNIFYMCGYFTCMYVCTMCLVPVRQERGHWIPGNWVYRLLWVAMVGAVNWTWVLWKSRSSFNWLLILSNPCCYFLRFWLPLVIFIRKILNEIFQNEQFVGFNLCAFWLEWWNLPSQLHSRGCESFLCPAYSFCICSSSINHFVSTQLSDSLLQCCSVYVQVTLHRAVPSKCLYASPS